VERPLLAFACGPQILESLERKRVVDLDALLDDLVSVLLFFQEPLLERIEGVFAEVHRGCGAPNQVRLTPALKSVDGRLGRNLKAAYRKMRKDKPE
jgi:hypothetical protein